MVSSSRGVVERMLSCAKEVHPYLIKKTPDTLRGRLTPFAQGKEECN